MSHNLHKSVWVCLRIYSSDVILSHLFVLRKVHCCLQCMAYFPQYWTPISWQMTVKVTADG